MKYSTRPGRVMLIADTHFHHDKMCEWSSRPNNFTELLINNLRRFMMPEDTLIHLGDVIFGKLSELKPIMESIPGTKILVRGNHDKETNNWYMRRGFSFVADYIIRNKTIFSHIPVDIQNLTNLGVVRNIHGHLHDDGHRPVEGWWREGDTHYCFVSEFGYKPIELFKFIDDYVKIEDKKCQGDCPSGPAGIGN